LNHARFAGATQAWRIVERRQNWTSWRRTGAVNPARQKKWNWAMQFFFWGPFSRQ